jgi:hypothetical protein
MATCSIDDLALLPCIPIRRPPANPARASSLLRVVSRQQVARRDECAKPMGDRAVSPRACARRIREADERMFGVYCGGHARRIREADNPRGGRANVRDAGCRGIARGIREADGRMLAPGEATLGDARSARRASGTRGRARARGEPGNRATHRVELDMSPAVAGPIASLAPSPGSGAVARRASRTPSPCLHPGLTFVHPLRGFLARFPDNPGTQRSPASRIRLAIPRQPTSRTSVRFADSPRACALHCRRGRPCRGSTSLPRQARDLSSERQRLQPNLTDSRLIR